MTDLKELTIDVVLSTTPVAIIASGATESVFPGAITFTNSSTTTARTVTVWRNKSGVSQTATNWIEKKLIQPQKTWIPKGVLGQAIVGGSAIWASQDVGADVNVNAGGTGES